LILPVITRED